VTCCDLLWASLPLVLFFIPSYYLPKYVFGTRMGIIQDMLILVDYRNRYAVGRVRRILLGKSEIFIYVIVVFLGHKVQPIYVKQDMERYILPLLNNASTITPFQKQQRLFRQRNPVLMGMIVILMVSFGLLLLFSPDII